MKNLTISTIILTIRELVSRSSTRGFSSASPNSFKSANVEVLESNNIQPVEIYLDLLANKAKIIKANINKPGVYR